MKTYTILGLVAVAAVVSVVACGGDNKSTTPAATGTAGKAGSSTAVGGSTTSNGGSTSTVLPTECKAPNETWASGSAYTFEDEVIWQQKVYNCLNKLTTNNKCDTIVPGTDATVWEDMEIACPGLGMDGGVGGAGG